MGDLDNLNLPSAIGRYQVIRLLGTGAMGSVVLAEDPRIKRKVAIKLMRFDYVRTEADKHEYLARFQREAEVSGLLNHPGIVAIYDVGEVEGLGPFLAMEFVPGRPLDGILKGDSLLSLKEKFRIAVGLAEALDHAHAKGVVHRDVKPGNVMVAEDGRAKLMDFGIAKREDASLTQTGTFLGTPSYASPEQIKDGSVDNRSDIFSFGVLVFELMSGQSPFPGTSINTILYRIVNEPPIEVQPPVVGLLPEGWRRVFDRVLAKQPADRHPSCTAFVRDLLDAVVELGKEDRRELLGLMGMSRDATIPEITSTSFDETMVVGRSEDKKPNRTWLVALGLVAALSMGWWLFLRGPKGTRLQIKSQPSGAEVFVNDLPVGRTPVNQPLVPGDRLRLELKGYRPVAYDLKAGETAPAEFPLLPIVTEELVNSTPAEATVVLDEKAIEGQTPLKVQWNQGQPHRLTITKGRLGFAADFGPGETPGGRAFELKEAATAETLQEPALDPKAPGAVKLSGGFSVKVKADGKDLGELSPGAKLPLDPGPHQLELSSVRHHYRDRRSVTIAAGQTLALTLPGLATLTVETFPGTGKVFVDDQDTGIESDGSSVQIAQGRHSITVRGPKGIKHQTVDLTGDKTLKFPL
ncbi:serine/threonine-protein kinase [Geothrix sp. PMB-07]|uniref:serine/threonine-protein kinase n=1 Tax=Geothrix sp. PMB-07 TaxID=3068640 RepID=UPI002741C5E8|nr:serine/threonine-protein kinase [Geothrix sp. PMB-07]WLT33518.1 serine/threonine-protein kinase [Geothrix sp. PMB-07]